MEFVRTFLHFCTKIDDLDTLKTYGHKVLLWQLQNYSTLVAFLMGPWEVFQWCALGTVLVPSHSSEGEGIKEAFWTRREDEVCGGSR